MVYLETSPAHAAHYKKKANLACIQNHEKGKRERI